MSAELKQAIDTIQQNFEEFKKTHKDVIAQQMKGYVDPLLTEKFDKLNDAITKAEDAKQKAESAMQAAEEAQLAYKRHFQVEKTGMNDKDCELRTAFMNYVRLQPDQFLSEKDRQLLEMHTKGLSSASDTGGGYFVVPDLDREITRVLNETSPVRTIANVKQISSDQYEKLHRPGRAGARWADRDNAPTKTSTQDYKKITIKAWKLEAYPEISQDLLDDASYNVEQDLQSAIVEEFSLMENETFIKGDGAGQPKGILKYPAGNEWGKIEQINSGSATGLTYNGLIDLVYSLKDGYLSNAVFIMNRLTVAAIRKQTDENKNPLWMPGFGSEPPTLLGYPIIRAADMPNIESNALAIAFGDFRRGYVIVDRLGTRVLRDPYTAKPHVLYYTTKRVGGGVDNFEAIKLLKISA